MAHVSPIITHLYIRVERAKTTPNRMICIVKGAGYFQSEGQSKEDNLVMAQESIRFS